MQIQFPARRAAPGHALRIGFGAALALSASGAIAAPLDAPLVAALAAGGLVAPLPPDDAEETLARLAPADYADTFGTPAGAARPDTRTLSNALSRPENKRADARPLSNLAVAYFQLIASHEIAHTRTDAGAPLAIPLQPGDPLFDPSLPPAMPQAIPFSRSQIDPATGTGPGNPREQLNHVTKTFDASTVYGSNSVREAQVRVPGSAKLKIGPMGDLPVDPGSGRHFAGDERADENPNLQSLHALFVREHNRRVDEIAALCPDCSTDQVYEAAKALVANMQHRIFYDELVPLFLGSDDLTSLLPPGMSEAPAPAMFQEFTAAAGRLGHSQVPDTIETAAPGGPVRPVDLKDCFFNAACLAGATEAEKLYGAAQQAAEPVDTVVVDALRNAQLTGPGAGFVIDLFATNMQRGRDHGLPDYETVRAELGLPSLPLDLLLPGHVLDAYGPGAPDGIDLLVGLFAEFRDPAAYLGPTGTAIWAVQLEAIRDDVLRFGASQSTAQALLDDWLDGVSMAGLLSRDTGYDLAVWGDTPFLAAPNVAAVPLPPALGFGLAGIALLWRLRSRR